MNPNTRTDNPRKKKQKFRKKKQFVTERNPIIANAPVELSFLQFSALQWINANYNRSEPISNNYVSNRNNRHNQNHYKNYANNLKNYNAPKNNHNIFNNKKSKKKEFNEIEQNKLTKNIDGINKKDKFLNRKNELNSTNDKNKSNNDTVNKNTTDVNTIEHHRDKKLNDTENIIKKESTKSVECSTTVITCIPIDQLLSDNNSSEHDSSTINKRTDPAENVSTTEHIADDDSELLVKELPCSMVTATTTEKVLVVKQAANNPAAVSKKLVNQVANMDKNCIKDIINNPQKKFDTALKVHARKILCEQIRKKLQNMDFDRNESCDSMLKVDEYIDSGNIPEGVFDEISKALGIDFFNEPHESPTDVHNDIPSNLERVQNSPAIDVFHSSNELTEMRIEESDFLSIGLQDSSEINSNFSLNENELMHNNYNSHKNNNIFKPKSEVFNVLKTFETIKSEPINSNNDSEINLYNIDNQSKNERDPKNSMNLYNSENNNPIWSQNVIQSTPTKRRKRKREKFNTENKIHNKSIDTILPENKHVMNLLTNRKLIETLLNIYMNKTDKNIRASNNDEQDNSFGKKLIECENDEEMVRLISENIQNFLQPENNTEHQQQQLVNNASTPPLTNNNKFLSGIIKDLIQNNNCQDVSTFSTIDVTSNKQQHNLKKPKKKFRRKTNAIEKSVLPRHHQDLEKSSIDYGKTVQKETNEEVDLNQYKKNKKGRNRNKFGSKDKNFTCHKRGGEAMPIFGGDNSFGMKNYTESDCGPADTKRNEYGTEGGIGFEFKMKNNEKRRKNSNNITISIKKRKSNHDGAQDETKNKEKSTTVNDMRNYSNYIEMKENQKLSVDSNDGGSDNDGGGGSIDENEDITHSETSNDSNSKTINGNNIQKNCARIAVNSAAAPKNEMSIPQRIGKNSHNRISHIKINPIYCSKTVERGKLAAIAMMLAKENLYKGISADERGANEAFTSSAVTTAASAAVTAAAKAIRRGAIELSTKTNLEKLELQGGRRRRMGGGGGDSDIEESDGNDAKVSEGKYAQSAIPELETVKEHFLESVKKNLVAKEAATSTASERRDRHILLGGGYNKTSDSCFSEEGRVRQQLEDVKRTKIAIESNKNNVPTINTRPQEELCGTESMSPMTTTSASNMYEKHAAPHKSASSRLSDKHFIGHQQNKQQLSNNELGNNDSTRNADLAKDFALEMMSHQSPTSKAFSKNTLFIEDRPRAWKSPGEKKCLEPTLSPKVLQKNNENSDAISNDVISSKNCNDFANSKNEILQREYLKSENLQDESKDQLQNSLEDKKPNGNNLQLLSLANGNQISDDVLNKLSEIDIKLMELHHQKICLDEKILKLRQDRVDIESMTMQLQNEKLITITSALASHAGLHGLQITKSELPLNFITGCNEYSNDKNNGLNMNLVKPSDIQSVLLNEIKANNVNIVNHMGKQKSPRSKKKIVDPKAPKSAFAEKLKNRKKRCQHDILLEETAHTLFSGDEYRSKIMKSSSSAELLKNADDIFHISSKRSMKKRKSPHKSGTTDGSTCAINNEKETSSSKNFVTIPPTICADTNKNRNLNSQSSDNSTYAEKCKTIFDDIEFEVSDKQLTPIRKTFDSKTDNNQINKENRNLPVEEEETLTNELLILENGDSIDCNYFTNGHYETPKLPISWVKLVDKYVIAASEDGTIYKYNGMTRRVDSKFSKHTETITQVKIHQNNFVYSISLDGYMRKTSIENFGLEIQSVNLQEPLQAIELEWGIAYIGSRWGNIFTYNTKMNKLSEILLCSVGSAIMALKATKEGPRKVLIVASKGNQINLRDATSGLLLRIIGIPTNININNILLDGSIFYCSSSRNEIYVYDFASGNQMNTFQCGNGAVSMKLYKNKLLFIGCYDGFVYVIDKTNGTQVARFPGSGKVILDIDVISEKLITSSKDNNLQIIDIPNYILALVK